MIYISPLQQSNEKNAEIDAFLAEYDIKVIAHKIGVTAEIVQMDDPWHIPSDTPQVSSQLGESPTQLRSYLLP